MAAGPGLCDFQGRTVTHSLGAGAHVWRKKLPL